MRSHTMYVTTNVHVAVQGVRAYLAEVMEGGDTMLYRRRIAAGSLGTVAREEWTLWAQRDHVHESEREAQAYATEHRLRSVLTITLDDMRDALQRAFAFTWPCAPAKVYVPDYRNRHGVDLINMKLERRDAGWYRHVIAEHGAPRAADLELLDWLGRGEARADYAAAQLAAEKLTLEASAERVAVAYWDAVRRRSVVENEADDYDLEPCVVKVTPEDLLDAFMRNGWLDALEADDDEDFDDAVWRTVVPGREPEDVAATLRSWGVTDALEGVGVLMREMDPANRERTAGLDPLDPSGGPLAADVLVWSLASTLQRAGMPLGDEGTDRQAP